MRKVLKIAGVVVVLFIAAIGSLFYFTSPMVTTGDTFFKAVAARDFATARICLAQDFRAATSEEELRSFLERSALLDYSAAHWASRQISLGGTGHLEGDVTTRSHGTVPVSLGFIREGADWRIYSIKKPNAGLVTDSGGQAIPSKTEAGQLAVSTTLAFAKAVNAHDLKPFFQDTATEFQKQVTLEKFTAGFGTFVDHHVDLTPVENKTPIFTVEPGMTPDGVLLIEGYFPFKDARVKFAYKYVYRFTGWKLLGINLNVAPADGRQGT